MPDSAGHEFITGEFSFEDFIAGLPSDSDQILGPPFPCIVWHPDGMVRVEFPDGDKFEVRRSGDATELERHDRARLDAIYDLIESKDLARAHEQASLFLGEISHQALARFWEQVAAEDLADATC